MKKQGIDAIENPPPDAPKVEPWHRQSNETEKAYEAFEIYLNLEDQRTFERVAQTLGKSDTLVRRWKEKYKWEDRALAYDRFRRTERDRAQATQIHKIEEQNRKRRMQIRDMKFEIGLSLVEVGKQQLERYKELLKFPVTERRTEGEELTLADGQKVKQTVIVKPLPARVGDPLKALKDGLDLMSQSADMPTDTATFNLNDLPSLSDDINDMTEEEIDAELARLSEQENQLNQMIENQRAKIAHEE